MGEAAVTVHDLHKSAHLSGRNVAVLGIWGVAGIISAARRFQWQPRATDG